MEVTDSSREPLDLVPIGVRYPLLLTWVQAKQMLQSQISKGFTSDKEVGFQLLLCELKPSVKLNDKVENEISFIL